MTVKQRVFEVPFVHLTKCNFRNANIASEDVCLFHREQAESKSDILTSLAVIAANCGCEETAVEGGTPR